MAPAGNGPGRKTRIIRSREEWTGDMSGEDNQEQLCEQCGLCCRIFGDRISPTPMNLFLWMEAGRSDILCHFSACLNEGRWINCADLKPEDLGNLSAVELKDPVTGEYPPVCPFLHRVSKKRYVCRIHTVKPEMCCHYQPWIWGETYFNQCKALGKLHRGSQRLPE
jgi:Fe-S-cluster containining protein